MRVLLGPLAALALALPASAQTVEKLYIMDCGHNAAVDQARWSPGVNVGKPIELSDNCYLMKHGTQWLLWDTGYPDAVADKPLASPAGTATRARKLAAQLAELNVKPADIAFVAVSHTHGDHVGNVDMFPASTLLIQKAEVDWAFAEGKKPPFRKDRPMKALTGDMDVFGDGSATILSTPGHTPGHQSLLVHLRNSGFIMLSGDVVHLEENFEKNIVPSLNTNKAESIASMARVRQLIAVYKATFFINHDKSQTDKLRLLPAFYD